MRVRTVSIGLAALLPIAAASVPSNAHPVSVSGTWSGKSEARGDALLQSTVLAIHASERARYGAPPLVWNPALAADAAAYATTMARTETFAHDTQNGTTVREGENLSMGTRGAFSYGELVGFWANERTDFKPGKFPAVSRSGDWSNVGHYTQMVWPETREVGCAVASTANDDYLVCRYLPAGNIVGIALR